MPRYQERFDGIGTEWIIEAEGSLSSSEWAGAMAAVRVRIEDFDRAYSRFRPDSLVTEMSQKSGTYRLPADAEPLFSLYRDLYRVTSGMVTPLIGQVMIDAGYDASYSLLPKTLHPPRTWHEVLDYAYPRCTLKEPAMLDFGAAGKGYLIDLVLDQLISAGLTTVLINAGGDIRVHDAKGTPASLVLEDPRQPGYMIGTVELANRSLCGSAGNRRTWADFHHIIDPYRLQSPRHILATWAIADSGLLADAMATSLFFVSPSVLTKEYPFEYLVLRADGSVDASPKFPVALCYSETVTL